jgi:hypothetical protein
MRVLQIVPLAMAGAIAAGTIAACSGASQPGPPVAQVQTLTNVRSGLQSLNKEWLSPGVQSSKIFAVVGNEGNLVIIDFKSGALLATIAINEPQGLCLDDGTVWVGVGLDSALRRYSGAGKLLATLSDPGQIPNACSVYDGTLAVANIETISGGTGSVTLFAGGKGTGKSYAVPGMQEVFYVTYDSTGDLLAAGTNGNINDGSYRLAELKHGASRFTVLTLRGASISFPGGMQYADNALTISDLYAPSTIYQAHLVGSTVKVTGSTSIDGEQPEAWYIHERQLIVSPFGTNNIVVYAYPAGGSTLRTLRGSYGEGIQYLVLLP